MCQIVEYIWTDVDGNLRSKTRIVYNYNYMAKWNYDGSSTGQANTENSEIILVPTCVFSSITNKNKYYVICSIEDVNGKQLNDVLAATKLFKEYDKYAPMFGLEQEFFMIDTKTNMPLGMKKDDLQGKYYCGVGANNAYGREYLNEVRDMCLDYGIKLTGMNYEVAPGQAEFQVCDVGINACHGLTMLRYFMHLVGEKYGIAIDYSPKPYAEFNGTGCHINFSTSEMRNIDLNSNKSDYNNLINPMFDRLRETKDEFIENFYGYGNKARLTGSHETGSYKDFTVQEGGRGGSIRVSPGVNYFEDRRPAGNIDPYIACAKMFSTCIGVV
jgi:glutamine synthetase